MKNKTIYFRIFILLLLALCLLPYAICAYADAPPEPVSISGVQYILGAPESFTTQITLLEEQALSLQNGQPTIVSWSQNIPQEAIASYVSQYSNSGITFTRTVSISSLSTLVLSYSREAYQSGEQFLSGTMTQRVTTVERIVSGGYFPTSSQKSMIHEVVREVSAGNFAAITPENTIGLSFPIISSGVVSGSGLEKYYPLSPMQEEYSQNILLPSVFTSIIINNPTATPNATPQATPNASPQTTPGITTEPIVSEVPQSSKESTENLLNTVQENSMSQPKTVEVVAGAVSSAVLLGIMGAVTGATSSGSSAFASIASTSMQSVAHVILPGTATSTGTTILSFLKDIINGLRDMFMDESRAHASGKVARNIKKD